MRWPDPRNRGLRTLVNMLGEDDIVAGELKPQLPARVKYE